MVLTDLGHARRCHGRQQQHAHRINVPYILAILVKCGVVSSSHFSWSWRVAFRASSFHFHAELLVVENHLARRPRTDELRDLLPGGLGVGVFCLQVPFMFLCAPYTDAPLLASLAVHREEERIVFHCVVEQAVGIVL